MSTAIDAWVQNAPPPKNLLIILAEARFEFLAWGSQQFTFWTIDLVCASKVSTCSYWASSEAGVVARFFSGGAFCILGRILP